MKLATVLLGVVSCAALLIWFLRLWRRVRLLETFRRDFVVNISHEFKTPLSVIKGYAETLTEKSLPPETTNSFLQTIREHTERLIEMVENLLELSRLENIGPVRTTSLIPLPKFFETLRQRFRQRLERQGIAWRVELAPPLEHIESDRGLLEIIFNNLIDNAAKYTEGKGKIKIGGERQGRILHFCVEDAGIGIAPQDQERIFERFYRVDRARSRETGGTGLGLAIVKHAVQSLGGKIWVESELGKGSKFFFTLKEGR